MLNKNSQLRAVILIYDANKGVRRLRLYIVRYTCLLMLLKCIAIRLLDKIEESGHTDAIIE